MDILYGIEPLDALYGYEDGKPCLATLVCSESLSPKRVYFKGRYRA